MCLSREVGRSKSLCPFFPGSSYSETWNLLKRAEPRHQPAYPRSCCPATGEVQGYWGLADSLNRNRVSIWHGALGRRVEVDGRQGLLRWPSKACVYFDAKVLSPSFKYCLAKPCGNLFSTFRVTHPWKLISWLVQRKLRPCLFLWCQTSGWRLGRKSPEWAPCPHFPVAWRASGWGHEQEF